MSYAKNFTQSALSFSLVRIDMVKTVIQTNGCICTFVH